MDVKGRHKEPKEGVFFVAERQQRLDLILHLIANTQQAILLRGPEQSGKSYFIKMFEAQAHSRWSICPMSVSDLMATDEPLQLIADTLDHQDGSQKHVLSRLEAWDKAGKKIIICVEDAHTLKQPQFDFLFQLADNYSCVQLLLTSSENLGEALEQRCQLIDIEPLTQKQTTDYARHRLNNGGLTKSLDLAGMDELVLFIETGGLPGLINNALEQMQPAPTAKPTKKPSMSILADKRLIVFAVLAAIGVLVIDLWNQEPTIVVRDVVSPHVHVQQEKPLTRIKKTIGLIETKVLDEPKATVVKKVESKVLSAVLPQTKLVKLSQPIKKEIKLTKPIIKTVLSDTTKIVPALVADKPTLVLKEKETSKVVKTKQQPVATLKEPSYLQRNHTWIAQRKAEHYSVQLLGVSTEQSAREYVLAHKDLKDLLFFQNKRNSGAWFSVIYGDYVDLAAAQKASQGLPTSLGRVEPWLRRFDAIRAEVFVKK